MTAAKKSKDISTACVILAAGKGVRMKSDLPKVLHEIGGRPMVRYSVDCAMELGCDPVVVVLGNGAELVRKVLPEDVGTAIQEKQLGTGHAAQCGLSAVDGVERVLVLYGDTPLLTADTLAELLDTHASGNKPLAMLTADMPQPNRLGRVVRNASGDVERVIEAADASPQELALTEINAGIYVADLEFLKTALDKIKPQNAQGEYYLTDIVQLAADGGGVAAYKIEDHLEVLGVNDRIEQAAAQKAMNARTLVRLMTGGVTILDTDNTYVQPPVAVGPETVIYPGAVIEGMTSIGSGCVIGPGVFIRDSKIGDGVEIKSNSVVDSSNVGDGTAVGPSAHLRPASDIGPNCRIGNFVETKKVVMGEGTKASHLTYLGDAKIGKNVNIGCGTITCNYDGAEKHLTIIEDDVFVGSDSQLVAPITVKKGAYIGSGSTLTKDVEPGALCVTRANRRDIPGGGDRLKKKKKK